VFKVDVVTVGRTFAQALELFFKAFFSGRHDSELMSIRGFGTQFYEQKDNKLMRCGVVYLKKGRCWG
jgi:hypothetical protein